MNELRRLKGEWEEGRVKEALERQKERQEVFQTGSDITVERLYTPIELEEMGFDYAKDLGFPGQYPFTRGKDPLGYRANFWIFQQYAGYGDAEEAISDIVFYLTMDRQEFLSRSIFLHRLGLIRITPLLKERWARLGWPSIPLKTWRLFLKGFL